MMTSDEYNEWRRRLHAHEAEMACAPADDDDRGSQQQLGLALCGVSAAIVLVIASLLLWVVS